MGVIALSAEESVPVPPEAVFDLFGRGDGAGWLFDASCERTAVGAMVTARVPLGSTGAVDILGRISEARRPSRITIVHEQPWRGRIRLSLSATATGTRVRLHAEVDEQGVQWLLGRHGVPPRLTPPSGPRLGLLTSKSGPGALYAVAAENVATLAIEEVNADGGVGGEAVELMVADDRTDPGTGVIEAGRLARAGCRTVVCMTTSATFQAVSRAMEGTETLVVMPHMNEGGTEHPLSLRLGERPSVQLAAATPLMRELGVRRWFLAGNDYVWPRSVNATARVVLPELGGELVGERYAPLGSTDLGSVVDAVERSGADVVLNTFVGTDAALFERECHQRGLRGRTVSLGPAIDESTLERIGSDAAEGVYGVAGYFQGLTTDGNDTLRQRYRAAYGRWAPPLSSFSESVFESIHIWAAAARRAGTTDPVEVARLMRTGRFEFPRGTVTLGGTDQVHQQLYLAVARRAVFESVNPVDTAV